MSLLPDELRWPRLIGLCLAGYSGTSCLLILASIFVGVGPVVFSLHTVGPLPRLGEMLWLVSAMATWWFGVIIEITILGHVPRIRWWEIMSILLLLIPLTFVAVAVVVEIVLGFLRSL